MADEHKDEIKLTSDHTGLLKHDNESQISDEYLRSAAYTLGRMPYDSVSQFVNHVSDNKLLPEAYFAEKPETATFGSNRWVAQTLGTITGALPWIMVIGKGVQKAADPLVAKLGSESVSFMGLKMAPQTLATGESFLTGALYEGALRPVSDEKNYWSEKGANMAVGGATLGSFSWSYNKLLSKGLLYSPVEASLSGKVLSQISRAGVAGTAGLASGFVNAETRSAINEHRVASTEELTTAMLSYGAIGAGLGMTGKPEVLANPKQFMKAAEVPASRTADSPFVDPVLKAPAFKSTLGESRTLAESGKTSEAASKLDSAARKLNESKNTPARGDQYMELGKAYRQLGSDFTPQARSAYEEALSIFKGNASPRPEAIEAATRLSFLEEGAGNSAKAADLLDSALRIQKELSDSGGLNSAQSSEFRLQQSSAYDRLESLYRKSGQPERADALKATRPLPESPPDYKNGPVGPRDSH